MRYCLMLPALILVSGLGLAQDMAEVESDHNIHSQFITPHTAWATPYAQGTTRVLFFVNSRGTRPREAIELNERFDFDAQMVFRGRLVDTSRDDWHGGANGVTRMARLLAGKWDAFVFIGISPELMPAEQQYAMVKAVAGGTGLVLIGGGDKRLLKDKNKLSAIPALLSDVPGAAAYTVKQGRGVQLPPAPTIDYRPGWEVAYDQWDMRVGKAILWAAGKEPKLDLSLQPTSRELARDKLPAAAAKMRWQGAAPGTVAQATLRRADGQVQFSTRQALDQPQGAVELRIPLVRAGDYYLDVVARSGDRAAGFGSVPLSVTSAQRVAELTLDQDWAEVGEKLSGRVRLAGERRDGQSLVVSLFDRRHREIARQTVKADGAERHFQFAVQSWYPMLLEVRATLMDGSGEVASAWQFAHVVQRHRGRFNFVMWDKPDGNLAPWAEQSLADTGVTVHLSGGAPPTYLAAYDMAWIPYTTHVAAAKDARGVMTPACWNDEARIQAHVDQVVDHCTAARQHGVFAYSLGDEIAVRGSCLSPHCLAAYRSYLREQYVNIAALNASWGSTYASFDEVQLGQPGDNEEREALRAGNFPRWFDRQAYQSYNFCKLCERFGKGFRRIDPRSRCGFEGAGTFAHADDLDGFVRSNTFWSPYPGTADEVVRSIAPRDFPRANWMGYTKDADSLLEKYWRMVTRGCDGVWWWRWEVIGTFHGWLSPSLDPYPAVQEILKDTQIVRDGLGDLLLGAAMQTDGVGILFSQPSAYAARIPGASGFGSYEASHAAFHRALRNLGLNFLYFTGRQMRRGEVDLNKFKAIILPMTQALGPRETEMLRDYVRRGGLLIADVRPAIYDGHVKPLATGQLDDVFGVKRTGLPAAQSSDASVQAVSAAGKPETLHLQQVRADAGIQPTTAGAAGAARRVPLLLTNSFGKGQTLLLNLAMADFPVQNAAGAREGTCRLLQHALRRAAVCAPLSLTGADGQDLREVEITRWMNGPVQIVSLFRHSGTPDAATLRLPRPLHVYDLKARKYLGQRQSVSLTITPWRAMFYALAPQAIGPVQLKASPTLTPGSVQQITVTSTLPEGRQAVKLTGRLPDGSPADWLSAVVVAGREGTVLSVPVAYNDPKGVWTVTATELYTGAAVTAQFTVR